MQGCHHICRGVIIYSGVPSYTIRGVNIHAGVSLYTQILGGVTIYTQGCLHRQYKASDAVVLPQVQNSCPCSYTLWLGGAKVLTRARNRTKARANKRARARNKNRDKSRARNRTRAKDRMSYGM